MKVKSITPLLTSLVLATAASFTASALAEDAATQTQAAPAIVSPAQGANPTNNVGQSNTGVSGATGPAQNSSMPATNNVGSTDDVTPDTATGDDDY